MHEDEAKYSIADFHRKTFKIYLSKMKNTTPVMPTILLKKVSGNVVHLHLNNVEKITLDVQSDGFLMIFWIAKVEKNFFFSSKSWVILDKKSIVLSDKTINEEQPRGMTYEKWNLDTPIYTIIALFIQQVRSNVNSRLNVADKIFKQLL